MSGTHSRAFCIILTLVASAAPCRSASSDDQARPPIHPVIGYSASTALSATLARADVAAMRSIVQPTLLKGGFGEAHMNRHLLGTLKRSGNWSPLPARLGPQGIDGLFMRFDDSGNPRGLIVSEAKYGSSRLGMTSDGIQMGTRWRSVRLARMSSEYRAIARSIGSGEMAVAGPGGSVGKQRLQFALSEGGKVAVFARSRPGEPWEFVGPRTLMEQAGKRADLVAGYLRLASEGKIPYESPVYRISLRNGSMRVTIKDASLLGDRIGESSLPVQRSITLPLGADRLDQLRSMSRVEIAKILSRKYPHLVPSDVDFYSRAVVRSTGDFQRLISARPRSVTATIAMNSLLVGGIFATVDAVFQAAGQYRTSGAVDWGRVGGTGGITFLATTTGAGIGQGTIVFMTKNPVAYQFMSRTSVLLGVGSRNLTTSIFGGAAGGGVATVVIAFGGYFAGYYDLQTATRMTIAGGTGVVAGAGFATGLFAFATTFGTASTGTAIATLHGAALTSATGAWLGGGSLAAGGFGVMGGSIVVTGGVALVAIATAVTVHAVFSYSDRQMDCERIRLTLDDLQGRLSFPGVGFGGPKFQAAVIGNK